jgi:hypothetical protein|tara:strand:+ start:498 stop:776 length:279 start_codon:yes stop_codon:yes gene_type:complete
MKKAIHIAKSLVKDIIDQAWTLVALIIGWLVLEGTAKDITGTLIVGTLVVWVITFPLRYEGVEDEENLPRDGDGDGLIYDGTPKERKDPRKK